LLQVPELADRIQHLGELLRYGTSFDRRLSELAIIVTARCLRCQYEWFAHARLALEAGVPATVVEAIRMDRVPPFTDEKERLVWSFVRELVGSQRVSEATYAAVNQAFGMRGAVELAGIAGYYSMIAATLNAHAIDPPGEQPFPE
jgi:4-carboxymuconolactone decarboxylase